MNEIQKEKVRIYINDLLDATKFNVLTTRREVLTYIRQYLNNCEEMIDRNELRATKERKTKSAA